ncbi:PREDICTED: uncharacterized protein LOC108745560 isoform X2 [Trachymyrmex septentrionalis]|uniref:uncharacterized protein LOC108745560 isoform X2 n=1 Tax=Trachymyrmex septentrionalis TaxID=34720 RepID=UPI00084F497D|nr:PREDICTED: uncharacterized protein LOC108745560 isoform X2 [Trachymyrmex septentrionalis]
MMFTNKKNSLPERPRMPSHEHMLEDLDKAVVDDVAFKIARRSRIDRLYSYECNFQLKQLECALKKGSQQMHADNEEIKRLADDIRKQAKAALVT